MRTLFLVATFAMVATTALAQEPVGCDKFKWPVDKEMAALRATDLKKLDSGTAIDSLPVAGAIVLRTPKDAALPTPPERAPKDGTFAGFIALKAVSAGTYSVSLSAGAWLDVVQNGQFLKAKSFSGVQACDGIRKVVKFDLSAAPTVVQISGASADTISVAVMPASD